MTESYRLEFKILDAQGKEYHRWMSDVTYTFVGKRYTTMIFPSDVPNTPSPILETKAQTLMFLRRHIHPILKKHCLKKEDLKDLYDVLKQRFNNLHDVQLPELTAR